MLRFANRDEKTDQLRRRLKQLEAGRQELEPEAHTESQLILRDVFNIDREIPQLDTKRGYVDYKLDEHNILRIRLLHPERPEHITGADVIYERHSLLQNTANIAAVQYKIWDDDKVLYLSDKRLQAQLKRMEDFFCGSGICKRSPDDHDYRFPFCSAFIRPTDRLQTPDQRLTSSGEHLPICQIANISSQGAKGADRLDYKQIRGMSLSHEVFEGLFTHGKIGSKTLTYPELEALYASIPNFRSDDGLLFHIQEFDRRRKRQQ